MREDKRRPEGMWESLKDYVPVIASGIQMLFGTMFAFVFISILGLSTLIGIWQIHSLSEKVDALQTRIEEQQRIIEKQGTALEAVSKVIMEDQRLERQARQDKAVGDALDNFLERALKIGEMYRKQEMMDRNPHFAE